MANLLKDNFERLSEIVGDYYLEEGEKKLFVGDLRKGISFIYYARGFYTLYEHIDGMRRCRLNLARKGYDDKDFVENEKEDNSMKYAEDFLHEFNYLYGGRLTEDNVKDIIRVYFRYRTETKKKIKDKE